MLNLNQIITIMKIKHKYRNNTNKQLCESVTIDLKIAKIKKNNYQNNKRIKNDLQLVFHHFSLFFEK